MKLNKQILSPSLPAAIIERSDCIAAELRIAPMRTANAGPLYDKYPFVYDRLDTIRRSLYSLFLQLRMVRDTHKPATYNDMVWCKRAQTIVHALLSERYNIECMMRYQNG